MSRPALEIQEVISMTRTIHDPAAGVPVRREPVPSYVDGAAIGTRHALMEGTRW